MRGFLRRSSIARWAKSLIGSLSLRLFLWLFGVIIVAFAVYASVSVRSTSRQWEQTVHEFAQQISDLIQKATHHGMLLNRKDDVHNIIRTIAEEPGVEGVRVYDKQGVIIFSAESAEIGDRVDLQAEACITCHDRADPLQAVPEGRRVRIFERPGRGRVLGLINPIENTPECASAACHAHPPEQSILGVLDVRMSMASADARLASAKRQVLIAAVLTALATGLFSAGFIFRVVRRPVRRLIRGAERVARGDLDTEIRDTSGSEIGQLAAAFNEMTRDLREARRELTEWSARLETRLQEKTAELSRTQRQIAQMDKMASLGRLAATVAHELNNPLAGILNYAKLVERTLAERGATSPDSEELGRYLSLVQKEAARSGVIVRNLLAFARRSGVEFALHPVNPILERSVMLVRHHMEMSDVKLELGLLEGEDKVICDADQLQQALVALLVNAVEAMPNGGTLRLAVERVEGSVLFTIADTGVGIAEEALHRIFEPFFSSKEGSEASGLGLAVVYGIVQRHGGRIDVESRLGRGTTFRIVLPPRPPTPEDRELTDQEAEVPALLTSAAGSGGKHRLEEEGS